MSTLLKKCYLVKVSTKGGGVKNTPNYVYVVCTCPHIHTTIISTKVYTFYLNANTDQTRTMYTRTC